MGYFASGLPAPHRSLKHSPPSSTFHTRPSFYPPYLADTGSLGDRAGKNRKSMLDETSTRHWNSILLRLLRPDVPIDLLEETVESLVNAIRHEEIVVTSETAALSLSQLESHALTDLLELYLAPVMDSAGDSDSFAWEFLAARVVDAYWENLGRDPTAGKQGGSSMTVAAAARVTPNPSAGVDIHEEQLSNKQTIGQGEQRQQEEEEGEWLGKHECELCERTMPLTIHHLIPRSTHAYFLTHQEAIRLPLAAAAVAAQQGGGPLKKAQLLAHQARLCRPCHSQIHRLVPDHRELGSSFNTIERLVQRPDVRKWIHYVRQQRRSDASMGRGLRYRR